MIDPATEVTQSLIALMSQKGVLVENETSARLDFIGMGNKHKASIPKPIYPEGSEVNKDQEVTKLANEVEAQIRAYVVPSKVED